VKVGESLIEVTLHKFKTSLRGYNIDEVDSYLEILAEKIHRVQQELEQQKRENEGLKLEIKKYQTVENALQETLVETKKNAEVIRRAAEKEAELILQKAEEDAKQRVLAIQQAVADLRREVEQLEQKRLEYIERLRHLAERQLNFLEFHEDRGGTASK
jgi:cell division initiation protein